MSNNVQEQFQAFMNASQKDIESSTVTPKKSNKGIARSIIYGLMIVSVILLIAFVMKGNQPEVAQAAPDPITTINDENAKLADDNKKLQKQINVNNLMIESNNKKLEALTYDK